MNAWRRHVVLSTKRRAQARHRRALLSDSIEREAAMYLGAKRCDPGPCTYEQRGFVMLCKRCKRGNADVMRRLQQERSGPAEYTDGQLSTKT